MLAEATRVVEDEFQSAHHGEAIVGESPAFKDVLRQVEIVAPTDATVLLRGETGTGKELMARAIHQLSARRHHALITVNCAAMPSGLLESELFGHERGAFTGALARKLGRFELAHQGTLFLDEIGDLPLELQPKLLRVLQEQAFERVGDARTRRVDVRLVAATNRDLAPMVDAGQFRADLYYRLHVFPVTLPPLRQRPEDIPLLVRHFGRHHARHLHKCIDTIPAAVMQALWRPSPVSSWGQWSVSPSPAATRTCGMSSGRRLTVTVWRIQATCGGGMKKGAAKESGLPLEAFPETCPWSLDQLQDEDFLPEAREP